MMATSVGRARLAVMIVFLVNGAVFANWAPRIPAVQSGLGIDPALLGVALTGAGIGGLLFTPFAAIAIGRFGSRRVTIASALALSTALILPGVVPTWWALLLALVVLGGLDGVMDVAMNTQGVLLEKRTRRSLLNGFHASWSVGAVLGGVIGTAAASVGMAVPLHFALAAVLLAATASAVSVWLPRPLPGEETNDRHEKRTKASRRFVRPPAALVALGLIVLFAALIEDIPQSWSAVFLSSNLGAGPGTAGLAFVAFSTAMFVGRLVSDRLVDRWGPVRVLQIGAVLVTCGFGSAFAIDAPAVAIAAFAVAGLGAAPIFPVSFGIAGRLPGVDTGVAIGTVSLVSRAGFLVAPLVVGAAGAAYGFGLVFTTVGCAGLVIFVLTTAARRKLS